MSDTMNRREIFTFGASAVAAMAVPIVLGKASRTARVIKDDNFYKKNIIGFVDFDETSNEYTLLINPLSIITNEGGWRGNFPIKGTRTQNNE